MARLAPEDPYAGFAPAERLAQGPHLDLDGTKLSRGRRFGTETTRGWSLAGEFWTFDIFWYLRKNYTIRRASTRAFDPFFPVKIDLV